MARYLTDFRFLSDRDEASIRRNEQRTCFNALYPCSIFPLKGLGRMEFSDITILYGDNGSGKSTALNIMASRLGFLRSIPFKPTPFFDKHVDMTDFNEDLDYERKGIPADSRILCSEDVFDETLCIRAQNREIDHRRGELEREWFETRNGTIGQRRMTTLHGPEYEKYKRTSKLLKTSLSAMVREEIGFYRTTGSNGENGFNFFLEKIRGGACYLLDEPEDSLSAKWQRKLASFILGMARFEKCQFVVATHSPFLLGIDGAVIYDLDTDGVPRRKWHELENVREYHDFFASRAADFEKEDAP